MKKWIIILLLVAVAAGASTYYITQIRNQSNLLAYVPADTAYYFGGAFSPEIMAFSLETQMAMFGPRHQQLLEELLASASDESPQARFANYLLELMTNSANNKVLSSLDSLGISPIQSSAMYSQGVMPVMKMALLDASFVEPLIEDAVKESGWNYRKEILDDTLIRVWPLVEDKELSLELGVMVKENILTFSFLTSKDSEKDKRLRFGLLKPENSLATTDEVSALREKYNFKDYPMGFFHIQRIAQGILDPDSNSFGQHLKQLMPEESAAKMQAEFSDACRKETLSIFGSVPRLVFGFDNLVLVDDTLKSNSRVVLESTNSTLLGILQSMQGQLPGHVLSRDEKLVSLAYGINIGNLTEAVASLKTYIEGQDVACESLVKLQQDAKKIDINTLQALTPAATVKGLGLSLYSFDPKSLKSGVPSGKAIVSIVSTSPEVLLGVVASMVTPLTGIELNIPLDGSVVELPLPIPSPQPIKATVQNNEIILFTGEGMDEKVAALPSQAPLHDGLLAFSMDYMSYMDLFLSASPESFMKNCEFFYEIKDMYGRIDMNFSTKMAIDQQGFNFDVNNDQRKPTATELIVGGSYQTDFLGDDCQWSKSGVETFNADGTGYYEEKDETGECVTYSSRYTWRRQGWKLLFTSLEEASRESCSDELEKTVGESYDCLIMNVTDEGFNCTFDSLTDEPYTYRYRQP